MKNEQKTNKKHENYTVKAFQLTFSLFFTFPYFQFFFPKKVTQVLDGPKYGLSSLSKMARKYKNTIYKLFPQKINELICTISKLVIIIIEFRVKS